MQKPKRCPSHPGYILKMLYIKPSALTITKLAENLDVSRKAVSAIVNEHKSITAEMALRLAQAFPSSTPETWLKLQSNYDLWQAEHQTSAWKFIQPMTGLEFST